MPRWEGIMDGESSSSSLPEPIWLSGTITSTITTASTTGSTVNNNNNNNNNSNTTTTGSNTTTGSSTSTTTNVVVPPNHHHHHHPHHPTTIWKPLRKCDCQLLNQRYTEYMTTTGSTTTTTTMTNNNNNNNNDNHLVYIDGGRKVVNMNDMTMSPTYGRNSNSNNNNNNIEESVVVVVVTRATWFLRYDYHHSTHMKYVTMTTTTNNNNKSSTSSQPQMEYKEDGTTVQSSYILYPIMDMTDVQNIETFYQDIIQEISTTWNNSSSSSSSFSSNTKSKLLEKTILIDQGTYKVQIQYNSKNDIISLRKVPNETGWISNMVQFKPSFTLQRGYSPYQVPGEDIELALGPVRHLVFVIHGIGEALFHRTDIQITGMIQQTNQLRHILQTKQYTQWKTQCQNITKKNRTNNNNNNVVLELPPPPNRIEVIPIEWYHCLHGSPSSNNSNNNTSSTTTTTTTTEDLIRNLQLVTLNTIPALRTIANDVLLDVLLYCTPTFGAIVLQTVTQQIQQYYHIFTQNVFPDFLIHGGKVSMVGHSLGSVIVWDLLATAKQQHELQQQEEEEEEALSKLNNHGHNGNHTDISRPSTKEFTTKTATTATTASYGPTVFPPMTDVIPFVPEYSILLGSPMGMFLSLRNATQLFHVETTATTTILSNSLHCSVSSFTLPTNHLYNIFHPSDPVAYRIEPLLLFESPTSNGSSSLSSLYSNLPEPVYLTVPGEDVRLHVKAIQFTNVVRKSLFSSSSNHSKSNLDRGTFRTSSHHSGGGGSSSSSSSTAINSWTSLLESAIANVSSTQQQTNNDKNDNNNSGTDTNIPSSSGSRHDSTTSNDIRFPLGGPKNPRIDYCLQPLIVDNEYISAVTAHSSYFSNTDVQDFLIGILK